MVSAPGDALAYVVDIKDQQREHFKTLYLNARNQIVHSELTSIGSLSSAIVHPREVFHWAVQYHAASVILAHNHPSGDVAPSQDDINLTRRLVQAGEILGIDVLDHIIVGPDDFISSEGARTDLGDGLRACVSEGSIGARLNRRPRPKPRATLTTHAHGG